MVVEISKFGRTELKPGCRDDRTGRRYVNGWERKCTSKARIRDYELTNRPPNGVQIAPLARILHGGRTSRLASP